MDFEYGMDQDFSYMDDEDFGLARNFTTAPVGVCHPSISLAQAE